MSKGSIFAVRVLISGLPRFLTYELGEDLSHVDVGYRVKAEVGRSLREGWVVEKLPLAAALVRIEEESKTNDSKLSAAANKNDALSQLGLFGDLLQEKSGPRLKKISQASEAFSEEQLSLFKWMSEYYGAPLADVIENAIPKQASTRETLCALAKEELRIDSPENSELLARLETKAPVQHKILIYLLGSTSPVPLTHLETISPACRNALKGLEKKDLVELQSTDPSNLSAVFQKSEKKNEPLFQSKRPQQLTNGQSTALETIERSLEIDSFESFLLYGVTGSGKTEVYLRAIEKVLEEGGSALIVVPEIALTPQVLDQFQMRLNVPLALLHSQVGAAPRWKAWESILRGSIRVAIGARSAIFAPLKDLKLIVVDEEHEGSYKQSDSLRYNARDVAVMRGKFSNATVVLGSATPSFESLVNVQKKRYTLLELPERATSRPVPQIEIVDLSTFKRKEMASENISPTLHEAIDQSLSNKNQTVILYNRRGFASYLQCDSCNEVVSCPNCSVALTFHRNKNRLLCHYCNLSQIPPSHCAFCRNPETSRVELDENGAPLEKESVTDAIGSLSHRGGGTEKVVEELSELFPKATIVRMDRDTVGKKSAYREILGSMRSGEADILVGTQMIAKGHDLPGVTLVGIIDADVGLHLPDFRSSERAYQLITQAAGRSGRGKDPGRVLVQTRQARHPTIVATVTGRFKAFARYELQYRKKLAYPPLGRLLRLVISSTDRQEAFEGALLVKDAVRQFITHYQESSGDSNNGTPTILGPAPAPHERLRGRYRWHLLIKTSSAKAISELARSLNLWRSGVVHFKDFRLSVDVDPMEML